MIFRSGDQFFDRAVARARTAALTTGKWYMIFRVVGMWEDECLQCIIQCILIADEVS